MKVASVIKVSSRAEFLYWLDSLGYHIPYIRRELIWTKASISKYVTWVAGQEDFFYFK